MVTTVTLLPSDTTYLSGTSCDLDELGIYEENLTNQAGCDSLVVTEIALANGDTTYLSQQSCNAADMGTFVESFPVPGGCDSVVVTMVSLLAGGVAIEQLTTCDPAEVGTMETVLTAANGCDSLVLTVVSLLPAEVCEEERPRLYVPNAFSPNGDGLNDVLVVFANEQVVRVTNFQVYSRWGERVFEAFNILPNDFSTGWDGTFRGQPMDVGLFVYWAEVELADGSTQLLEGGVQLVR